VAGAANRIAVYKSGKYTVERPLHLGAALAGGLAPLAPALSAVGLSADSYELNHGVLVALETPDAEARWLKGEDVFAQVSCDRLNEGEDAPRKQRVIELLIAGALGRELPG